MLGFLKRPLRNWWENSVKNAPPANRSLDVSWVRLKSIPDNQARGSFIPELYELAKIGSLRCQIEEKEWAATKGELAADARKAALQAEKPELFAKLYIADGSRRKTAFELAVYPSWKNRLIRNAFEREYQFRQERGLPLPAMVSKFLAQRDYLQEIEKAGLAVAELPIGKKINISVGSTKSSLREQVLHYTAQWAAVLVTLGAVLAAVDGLGLGFASPWAIPAVMAATYLAKRCGNDFGFYDVAEGLHRDFGWLFSKDLAIGKKISVTKSFWAILSLAAIAVVAASATIGVWGGMLALSAQGLTALNALAAVQIGMSLSVETLGMVAMGVAGFYAGLAALGTFSGGVFCNRFLWGMSFWNNQVDFTNENPRPVLPVVNVATEAALFNKETQRYMAKHRAEAAGDHLNTLQNQWKNVDAELAALQATLAANDGRRHGGGQPGGPSQPAPVQGQPAPAQGQPAPAQGQPAPAGQQPAPAQGQPAPFNAEAAEPAAEEGVRRSTRARKPVERFRPY